MKDRRALFFAGAALLCFALVPLAEDAYREITLIVGVTYVLLAAASWLDWRSRR